MIRMFVLGKGIYIPSTYLSILGAIYKKNLSFWIPVKILAAVVKFLSQNRNEKNKLQNRFYKERRTFCICASKYADDEIVYVTI